MPPSDFEDECRQGCLHTLICLALRILRNLHLVPKKFYRKHCSCDLKIVAISFNHDTGSLNADALNLRKNFTQTIAVPEWTVGKTLPTDSPAAYAIKETQGHKITIKVQFTNFPKNSKAEIRAEGGGVLGPIDPQLVTFTGGVSVPAFVPVELNHHTIGVNGILLEDITWNWKFRCCGGGEWEPLQTTHHRIYVVLEEPTLPWKQSGFPDTQNPWTEALDYVCAWAAGQKNRDDAATAITKHINANLGLVYDNAAGASHYTIWAVVALFELTQFLSYLKTGIGLGNIVNCTDCATITTTFSNLVGCDLHASRMEAFFHLTPFRGIGAAGFACPGFGCGFSYHEVAWKGANGNADPIFDACLRVDGDTNPWAAPYSEIFVVNMIFSTNPGAPLPLAVPFNAPSYKERLCTNDAAGIGSCNPTGPWPNSSNGRRPVQ
jgi:hypothetical protein